MIAFTATKWLPLFSGSSLIARSLEDSLESAQSWKINSRISLSWETRPQSRRPGRAANGQAGSLEPNPPDWPWASSSRFCGVRWWIDPITNPKADSP